MAETVKIKLEVDNEKGKKELKEFEFSLDSLEAAYKEIRSTMRGTSYEADRMVEVMQQVEGGFVRVKLRADEVVGAMKKLKAAQVEAFKKSAQNLNELGDKISMIGSRITMGVTVPIVGAFAAAVASSEKLQMALTPIQDAFTGVSRELGDALVPLVIQATPLLTEFALGLTEMIKQFNTLPDGAKWAIMGVVGFAAALGPGVMAIGETIKFIAALKLAMAGLGIAGGASAAGGAAGAAAGAGAGALGAGALGGALALGGSIGGGVGIGALVYDWLAKTFGIGGGTRLNQFLTVGAYGAGRLFGGEQAGLSAAGAVGRATGAIPTVIYNNYGVDANNPYLKQALQPYIRNEQRAGGVR